MMHDVFVNHCHTQYIRFNNSTIVSKNRSKNKTFYPTKDVGIESIVFIHGLSLNLSNAFYWFLYLQPHHQLNL